METKPSVTIENDDCPEYGTFTVYDANDRFLGSFGAFVTAKDVALREGNYIVYEGLLVVGYK